MTSLGFFALELKSLNLSLENANEKLSIRIETEITEKQQLLKWCNSEDTRALSQIYYLTKRAADLELTEDIIIPSYPVTWNDFYMKSNLVGVNDQTVNLFLQTDICIRIIREEDQESSKLGVAKALSKAVSKKAVQEATVDVLFEVKIPLRSVLLKANNRVEVDTFLSDTDTLNSIGSSVNISEPSLMPDKSTISFAIYLDEDFAEYVMGSSILYWREAKFDRLPVSWIFQYPEPPVNVKAKVQPTAEELRSKYIEAASAFVHSQEKVVKYALTVGLTAQENLESQTAAEASLGEHLGVFSFPAGLLTFEAEVAAHVPLDVDVKTLTSLWSVTWGPSTAQFIHRRQKKRLISRLSAAATLPLYVKMEPVTPPVDSKAIVTGAPPAQTLQLSGTVELSGLLDPGASIVEVAASIDVAIEAASSEGSSTTPESDPVIIAYLSSYPALIASPVSISRSGGRQILTLPPKKHISVPSTDRDVVRELHDEIKDIISRIAREYSLLFPPIATAAAIKSPDVPLADRRAQFMHYLSTSGIYHSFKDKLKPRIQRIVRARYGVRSQALKGSNGAVDTAVSSIDRILSELYVFLVKESNLVLNKMYSDTIVARDAAELEKTAVVDDEVETPLFRFERLLQQAEDAEADGRFGVAEQFHMERLQIVTHDSTLGSEPASVYAAYSTAGHFYLRAVARAQSLKNWVVFDSDNGSDNESGSTVMFLDWARQAFTLAFTAQSHQWKTGLTLACILLELGMTESGEDLLIQVIESQRPEKLDLASLSDFDGYDSDGLLSVDPLCHSILAAHFHTQGKRLSARKALKLAATCFVSGDFLPLPATHGTPRRTAVICMIQATSFLFDNGFVKLGVAGLQLALASEQSVINKANDCGLPSYSLPYVRFGLKQLQFRAATFAPIDVSELATSSKVDVASKRASQALELAELSISTSGDVIDEMTGWLSVAEARGLCGADEAAVGDALKRALLAAAQSESGAPPLTAILKLGNILLQEGAYADALDILLPASQRYVSSSLMLLTGVLCMRLDRNEDAEEALLEANMLDNRNPAVWAYVSLLCLSCGPHRLEEAEAALSQALRLGLSSTDLTRELAVSFMSVDKLLLAEDLIRRVIALESGCALSGPAAASGGKRVGQQAASTSRLRSDTTVGVHPQTRKLLADILAGQNLAVQAVEEYQAVLGDASSDLSTKMAAAKSCLALLSSLGRRSEAKTVEKIIIAISTSMPSDSSAQ